MRVVLTLYDVESTLATTQYYVDVTVDMIVAQG